MTEAAQDGTPISRRRFLKVGLLGTALLTTAGITASLMKRSDSEAAAGYLVLRARDMPFLQASVPVVIAASVASQPMGSAVRATIEGIDHNLAHFSPAQRKMALQLFDVLTLPLTRGPLTGVWSDWEQSHDQDVRAFLEQWQHSRAGLFRQGYASLVQLISLSWYGSPLSWQHAGYPGPPQI